MRSLIRRLARLGCLTLGSIVGGVLGFVGGFLVAYAVGRSAFLLASAYGPCFAGLAILIGIVLLLILNPLGCLAGLVVGGYYTTRLRFLAQNF